MNLNYGSHIIEQRELDGYVNITSMAKANDVNVWDWSRTKRTKSYIQELARDTQISVSELVQTTKGGTGEQGTWAHPLLALNFGRWISHSFAIWCDKNIKLLLEKGITTVEVEWMQDPIIQNRIECLKLRKEQQRQAEVQIQLLVQQAVNKQLSLRAKEKAEQAIVLHTELKQELAALKSFIESRPPAVNQSTGQKINAAIQNLGRILANKEEQPIGEVIRSLWKELGLTMRNSEYKYDLNARIAHAKVEYDRLYKAWEEAGKPRGEKPAKPSRITVLRRDEMLRAGYCCTQQLAISYIR